MANSLDKQRMKATAWAQLKRGELERETESLILAAQDQDPR